MTTKRMSTALSERQLVTTTKAFFAHLTKCIQQCIHASTTALRIVSAPATAIASFEAKCARVRERATAARASLCNQPRVCADVAPSELAQHLDACAGSLMRRLAGLQKHVGRVQHDARVAAAFAAAESTLLAKKIAMMNGASLVAAKRLRKDAAQGPAASSAATTEESTTNDSDGGSGSGSGSDRSTTIAALERQLEVQRVEFEAKLAAKDNEMAEVKAKIAHDEARLQQFLAVEEERIGAYVDEVEGELAAKDRQMQELKAKIAHDEAQLQLFLAGEEERIGAYVDWVEGELLSKNKHIADLERQCADCTGLIRFLMIKRKLEKKRLAEEASTDATSSASSQAAAEEEGPVAPVQAQSPKTTTSISTSVVLARLQQGMEAKLESLRSARARTVIIEDVECAEETTIVSASPEENQSEFKLELPPFQEDMQNTNGEGTATRAFRDITFRFEHEEEKEEERYFGDVDPADNPDATTEWPWARVPEDHPITDCFVYVNTSGDPSSMETLQSQQLPYLMQCFGIRHTVVDAADPVHAARISELQETHVWSSFPQVTIAGGDGIECHVGDYEEVERLIDNEGIFLLLGDLMEQGQSVDAAEMWPQQESLWAWADPASSFRW